jgi:MoaA/NifB/PqqE/SkfB family radical SAM enzyme
MAKYTTIDYHVTSRCNQECPYCWGPQDFENEADTEIAIAIVRKVKDVGAQRIVFTGGDPLKRSDIGLLIRLAKQIGLEVALSATGDELTYSFLRGYGRWIDLISLPIDGSNETVSSKTKKQGHFQAIMHDLDMLADFPQIDVKLATPVTQYNLTDVPAIVCLLDDRAKRMKNRFFYNVFQAFPRAMNETEWNEIVVSDDDFAELKKTVEATSHPYRINWLDHQTLDRLYVMIFPDGNLTVPSGPDYLNYGPFLEIDDLEALLEQTDFDAPKHLRHSRGWQKSAAS